MLVKTNASIIIISTHQVLHFIFLPYQCRLGSDCVIRNFIVRHSYSTHILKELNYKYNKSLDNFRFKEKHKPTTRMRTLVNQHHTAFLLWSQNMKKLGLQFIAAKLKNTLDFLIVPYLQYDKTAFSQRLLDCIYDHGTVRAKN